MREIKFRGRALEDDYGMDVKEGDWVYGYYFEIEDEHYIVPKGLKGNHADILFGEFIEVDEKTIGQFTGLKDKNGNEIYEGDIVETRYGKFEVEYLSDGFHPFNLSCNSPDPNTETEVIGNIYENKGLLK